MALRIDAAHETRPSQKNREHESAVALHVLEHAFAPCTTPLKDCCVSEDALGHKPFMSAIWRAEIGACRPGLAGRGNAWAADRKGLWVAPTA